VHTGTIARTRAPRSTGSGHTIGYPRLALPRSIHTAFGHHAAARQTNRLPRHATDLLPDAGPSRFHRARAWRLPVRSRPGHRAGFARSLDPEQRPGVRDLLISLASNEYSRRTIRFTGAAQRHRMTSEPMSAPRPVQPLVRRLLAIRTFPRR